MGNSGSQNTVTETIQEEQWAHSFPRSCSSQTKFHFQHKVLPEKRPQLKLRATNNGEILQSGGTISGRHVKSAEEERIVSKIDRLGILLPTFFSALHHLKGIQLKVH